MTEDSPFTIHVIGEKTKKLWDGTFRAVHFLSHRKMLQKDRLVREYLGPSADLAEERGRAVALADCQVALTKAPEWWKEYDNGFELVDENVLVEVWRGIQAVQAAARGEKELTDTQKKALKETASQSDDLG